MDGNKDFKHFRREFERLADEARGYGLSTVVILCEENPIEQSETVSWFTRGGRLRAVGLLQHTMWELQSQG